MQSDPLVIVSTAKELSLTLTLVCNTALGDRTDA